MSIMDQRLATVLAAMLVPFRHVVLPAPFCEITCPLCSRYLSPFVKKLVTIIVTVLVTKLHNSNEYIIMILNYF